MTDKTIVSFQNVSYSYNDDGSFALSGVSLDISEGEFVAVVGHNGSGKSTLAKLINCILVPSEGHVFTAGMDTADESKSFDIRSAAGMVFQNPDNQIVATVVEEDVAFAPENLGVPQPEIRRRVDDALNAVGMYEYRQNSPAALSGGQKQRVAIAGVLAMQPRLIVLDEATAMLDPLGRREVTDIVRRLNRERGITVITITHHMSEAVTADRVIALNKGRVALDGTPAEVFAQTDRIAECGLFLPQPALLMKLLRDGGTDIGTALTAQDATDALRAYKESRCGA